MGYGCWLLGMLGPIGEVNWFSSEDVCKMFFACSGFSGRSFSACCGFQEWYGKGEVGCYVWVDA